jgi:hypothetical protein
MSDVPSESEIRGIVDGLRKKHPEITNESAIQMARTHLELAGREWSKDLERKITYCLLINPN